MNAIDRELELWRRDWSRGPAPRVADAAELRARSLRYGLRAALHWLVALPIAVLVSLKAWTTPEPAYLVCAVFVWLLLVAVAVLDLLNRRGTWRAETLSASAYAALEVRRLEAALRGYWIGWGILALEVAFFLPWLALAQTAGNRGGSLASAYGFLAAVAASFAVGLAIGWRQTRLKLERARRLERALGEDLAETEA